MRNSPADDEKLLLRNARLVLPHAVAEGMSLLVEGGRVARLREDSGAGESSGARVIDLGGLTVYPGFVDLYTYTAPSA
jgi:imidazolonepropionase-like amidohydrolase